MSTISINFHHVGGHIEIGSFRMIWMNQYRTTIFGDTYKFGFTGIQTKVNNNWNNIWFSGY